MDGAVTGRDSAARVPATIHQRPWIAPGVTILGQVTLGDFANVWFGTVLRGEAAPVELSEGANVQDNCVVEGVAGHPARLGRYAAMGHNARVIGATVEERVLIAISATVLPGAHVGTHSIIAANAVVPEGLRVPPRSLVMGQGRIVREVSDAEIVRIHYTADEYVRLAHEYRASLDGNG